MPKPTTRPTPTELDVPWLAVGVFEGQTAAPTALRETRTGALIPRLIASKDLPTGVGDTTALHQPSGLKAGSLLVFGLGSKEKFGPSAAFSAGVAVAKRLGGQPRSKVAVVVPEEADGGTIAELVCGLTVGQRGPDLKKSQPQRHAFGEVILLRPGTGSGPRLEAAQRRGQIVGEAVNLARELVNLPPAEKPPSRLAARAVAVAEGAGFVAEVWDETRLRQERFGGLLAVSSGSEQPPAFVRLEYRQAKPTTPTLALVGKGVTFDSGGLSLKPNESMLDMKCDMSGAAVVLATFQAVARLGLKVNLAGYLPLTENLTGGRAMKLGDVLTIRNGTTVEVLNTDAEGRLILADALSYAVEQSPGRVLDLATLTGACMVALGTKVAGLFSNDDAFAAEVQAASALTGERVWRLPLDDDYEELLKSKVADLKNVGGKYGGAITAAKFLQRFVGTTPWIHLDIAGPAWADNNGDTRDPGGTGCFVRTLVAWLEKLGED